MWGEHADTSEAEVRDLFARHGYTNVTILKGIFPDETHAAVEGPLRFVHIDVDVYQSAKDVVTWCFDRLVRVARSSLTITDFAVAAALTSFAKNTRRIGASCSYIISTVIVSSSSGNPNGIHMRNGGREVLRRLLIFCPAPEGGIAEHAHYQACAAVRAGLDVSMVAPPNYLDGGRNKPYRVVPVLLKPSGNFRWRLLAKAYFAFATVANRLLLAMHILRHGHKFVLFAATSETLALIWVWPHLALSSAGVIYAANIHDPERKMRGQSALWHHLSVKASVAPIRFGIIHEESAAELKDIPRHVSLLRAPYGCYELDLRGANGTQIRGAVAPRGSGRKVFLSLGHVADRKNIDKFIRAMPTRPQAALVVAGPPASSRDRPASYYVRLAEELGVADRVKIDAKFVPNSELKHYFDACDALLLSYSGEFVSQSGVLLLAANAGKPVLASSGPGPLKATVNVFDLGVTVDPNSVSEIERGIDLITSRPFDPTRWDRFRDHASWDRNIALLLDAVAAHGRPAPPLQISQFDLI